MRRSSWYWLAALGCPMFIAAVLLPLRAWISPTDVAMLELLWLVYLAQRSGYKSALVSTAMAVLMVNLCFVPPYYTLAVHDASFVISFFVMALFGVLVSYWADQARSRQIRLRRFRHQARRAALQAEREQQRAALLRSLSHDLRTPLATIMGASSMLADTELLLSAQQQRQQAENIYQQSLLLNQHFEKVLELSKAQLHGQLTVSEFSSDELVAAALARRADELRPLALQLQLSRPINLKGDMELLEIALANLLENAQRYGDAPFTLNCSATSHVQRIELTNQRQQQPEMAPLSYGLGLAICQSIATLHKGQFSFELTPQRAVACLEWPLCR